MTIHSLEGVGPIHRLKIKKPSILLPALAESLFVVGLKDCHRRPRLLALTVALMCAVFFNPASALEIETVGGTTFEGEIVSSGLSTISFRVDRGGLLMLSRDTVRSVRVDMDGKGILEGRLLKWNGGPERIRAGDDVIDLGNDSISTVHKVTLVIDQQSIHKAFKPARLEPASLAKDVWPIKTAQAQDVTYTANVAIETLIKLKLLPTTGLDILKDMTDACIETTSRLDDKDVEIGVIGMPVVEAGQDDVGTDDLQLIGNLWERDGIVVQLVAEKQISSEAVYLITSTLFENLPFLTKLDPSFAETSLDSAVAKPMFPVHPGAARYYEERRVFTSDDVDGFGNRHGFGSRAQM